MNSKTEIIIGGSSAATFLIGGSTYCIVSLTNLEKNHLGFYIGSIFILGGVFCGAISCCLAKNYIEDQQNYALLGNEAGV